MKKRFVLLSLLALLGCTTTFAQEVNNVTVNGQFIEYKTVNASFIPDYSGMINPVVAFQWYHVDSGNNATEVGTDSPDYIIPTSAIGKRLKVRVILSDSTEVKDTAFSALSPVVIINTVPEATAVSVQTLTNLNVGSVLLGKYTYTDIDGDGEGATQFQWSGSSTEFGVYSDISGATSVSYTLKSNSSERWLKFRVIPAATTGRSPGLAVPSLAVGPVNQAPTISGLSVSGTYSPGNTLTVTYSYNDPDGDANGSLIQWIRDGVEIPGATSATYNIVETDGGSKLKVRVTAKSLTGYPDTGNTLESTETTVTPASLPVASKVCISGKRKVGEVLTGKYLYVWSTRDEGSSKYEWLVDGIVVAGEDKKDYTVRSSDLNKTIEFRVTPRSKSQVVEGAPVKSSNLAWFTMSRKDFSISESNIPLIAEPSGGEFNGTGVTGSLFNPSVLNPAESPFSIRYTYTFAEADGGCVQKAYIDLTVSSAIVSFSGIDEPYCYETVKDTITVKKIPPTAVSKSFTLSDEAARISDNDSTIVINPQILGAGLHKDFIIFNYTDGGIGYKIKSDIVVDSVGTALSISNLSPMYCQEENGSTLFGQNLYPIGGSGNWSSVLIDSQDNLSSVIKPSKGSPGMHSISFTYTSPLGCKRTTSAQTFINPTPVADFTISDGCIEGPSDSIRFVNNSISGDPIDSWLWNFGDQSDNISNLFEPAHLYRTAGNRNVKLIAASVKGCRDTTIKVIELGIKPVADFFWRDDCFHAGEDLKLFDATVSQVAVASRKWLINGSLEIVDQVNPTYLKSAPGMVTIDYFVSTIYSNCSDTISKSVFIRPTVKLIEGDYFEDFEGTEINWFKDNVAENSWTLGTPDRVNIRRAASGTNAWFTAFDRASQINTNYAVEGPCFDFTGVTRPMVKLKIMKAFDKNRDGGALQYKVGNNVSWEHLGTLNDGIEWYNSVLISGRPGGTQIGWTTVKEQDTSWYEARQYLDILADKKDVKLRIVYGSDGTSQLNDGMAFDDIFIGERKRKVLIEHFTNASSVRSASANTLLNNMVSNATKDAVNIQYHTDFPGQDLLYNDNTPDPSSRTLFYGLSKVPYTLYGGGTMALNSFASRFDYLIREADSLDLKKRSMIDPGFELAVNASIADGIVNISGSMKATKELDEDNLTLYIAVVARRLNLNAGTNGETSFRNVLRKMLPAAGGTSLRKIWSTGESQTFGDFTWTVAGVYDASEIEVIAFIQNNNTKEVFQAATSGVISLTTAISDFELKESGILVYPNPSSGLINVDFGKIITSNSRLAVYNHAGILVKSFVLDSGITSMVIEAPGLPKGFYLLRLYENGIAKGFSKLVVTDK